MTLRELHEARGVALAGGLPVSFGDPAAELAAGGGAAGLVDRSTSGRLRLTGTQRADYLQRISAQDFGSLDPGSGVRAAVLERRGKIIDVFTAHAFEDHLVLLSSAALREPLRDWIRKFIFRDDVQVEDLADSVGHVTLVGPGAAGVIEAAAGAEAGALEAHAWRAHPRREGTFIVRGAPDAWITFHLLGPAASMDTLWEELVEAGAVPVGSEAFQVLRILCGVPEGGAEIDERADPMELGLDDAYSLSKGCFTGQEVLAKMQTHDSVRRALVGLEIGGGAVPEPGDALLGGGDEVGRVTSAAAVPGAERIVALGLVRREVAEPGTVLRTGEAGTAAIRPLPFPSR